MPMKVPATPHPWILRSEIVKGHQRGGTQLGFPTANLRLNKSITDQLMMFHNTVWAGYCIIEENGDDLVQNSSDLDDLATAVKVSRDPIPSSGIFAADSKNNKHKNQNNIDKNKPNKIYPTVFSVGSNPHFKDQALTVEPYILQKFNSDFYGRTLRLLGVQPMRQMGAYISLEALIADIKNDCHVGSRLLENEPALGFRDALLDPSVYAAGALMKEDDQTDDEFFKFLDSPAARQQQQQQTSHV